MRLVIALLVLFVSGCSSERLDTSDKYQRRDCITPTDTSYSWYGEVATVEAYSAIDGFSGKLYILSFPEYRSNSAIFDPEIEGTTAKVSSIRYAR